MTVTMATLTNTEVEISDESLDELRAAVRGDVLTPGDAEYLRLRPPYNAMHPGKPALVVRPTGTADVVSAINFAREHQLLVAVRGGGHSIAGLSSVDGGLLLDLARMNGVDVDPEARTVRVQGGALIGDLDHETQAFGLVAPSGIVSDTGVAGLSLGGGEGWVRRKHGMAVDNLLAAQVVCADGQVRTASADTNPDLFWALRGGGGNFGVVTSFTFRCHPVGPTVAFAGVFHPVEDAENVYRRFRDWAATAPDEVSALIGCTTLPPSEHTPPEIHDTPFVVTGAVYSGDPDEGMRVLQPLRDIGTPLVDISGPLPFSGVQSAFDEFFRRGTLRSYWKATYVEELTDEIIDILVTKARSRPSKRTFVVTFLMGGAINRVGVEETAYSERSANWMVSMDGNWDDPRDDDKVIAWVRGAWAEVHERGTGSLYLNFTGVADEAVTVGVESAFDKANLQRLEEIKAHYDPDNFFRRNNNILPASYGSRD
ncbi:FAD-binding oxidoreductase [Nocardioides iriomotensis]|uniref:FAD-binding oxidoreductase n=1 Tax=Nocardioides iriomotensis TaxID=715784 RepID=A0A4Q5IW20_9ACTN|nr:FAD-binding oxidoreductase [Nocardioides iriomotensis]RYU10194.1 FAD-binding oxidoreductase [Nocardioides iriomotensis]